MAIIRPEQIGDAPGISAVHEAAFPSPREARLVEALRSAGRLCISLVAMEKEIIVGHIAFSPVTVAGASGGVGLAPLAVSPAHQRRGIGGQLIRAGLDASQRADFSFVVVLGEPEYYGRFGFIAASQWGLVDEYGGGAAFQAIELRKNSIPQGAGLVRYAPEFAMVVD